MILALFIAGCGQVVEQKDQQGDVTTYEQTTITGEYEKEQAKPAFESIHISNNHANPDVITYVVGQTIELTITSDKDRVFMFEGAGVEEQVIANTPTTVQLVFEEGGNHEMSCVNCDVPLTVLFRE